MDDSVTRGSIVTIACPLLVALAAAPALGRGLPDPTRPAMTDVDPVGESAAPGAGGTPVLQSVLVSEARRIAVIDGQLLEVGDRVRGLVVKRIGDADVLLDGPGGTVALRLLPGVDRRATGARVTKTMKMAKP